MVSKLTGHIYEKRLILKHLQLSHNKCPFSKQDMTPEDLCEVKMGESHVAGSRPVVKMTSTEADASGNAKNGASHSGSVPNGFGVEINTVSANKAVGAAATTTTVLSASLPELLVALQNEWDALMLETHALREQLKSARSQLATSLFQNDAANRVIARVISERDEARSMLKNAGVSISNAKRSIGEDGESSAPANKEQLSTVEDTISAQMSKKRPMSEIEPENNDDEDAKKKPKVLSEHDSFSAESNEKPKFPESLKELIEKNGKELQQFRVQRSIPEIVKCRADLFKQAGMTRTAQLDIKADTGTCYCVLSKPDNDSSNDFAFAVGSHTGGIKIFRVANEWKESKSVLQIRAHGRNDPVTDLCYLNGMLVAIHEKGSVYMYKIEVDKGTEKWSSSEIHKITQTHQGSAVCGIAIHPTTELIALAYVGGHCSLFQTSKQTSPLSIFRESSGVQYTCVAFHPDGLLLGLGCSDGFVQMWDISELANVASLDTTSSENVHALAFSENGYYMVVRTAKNTQLWDLRKVSCIKKWTVPEDELAQDPVSLPRVALDHSGLFCAVLSPSSKDSPISVLETKKLKQLCKVVLSLSDGNVRLMSWGSLGSSWLAVLSATSHTKGLHLEVFDLPPSEVADDKS